MNAHQWIKAHGGEGVLTHGDVSQLKSGTMRVLELMIDECWHFPDEIRLAAGNGGKQASEGLRRLRDLRPILDKLGWQIEKQRISDSRLFKYRLVATSPVMNGDPGPAQQVLF